MDLFLDPDVPRTTTRQLFDQLRDAIVAGRLAPGDRLPPSRTVAAQLGISRHTVTTVYGRLTAEGYVEGKAGGGSYVSAAGRPVAAPPRPRRPTALRAKRRVVPPDGLMPTTPGPPPRYELRIGSPDPTLFPVDEWRRATIPSLHQQPPDSGHPAGSPELRKVVAQWIGRSRGVDADPDQFLITLGANQAVDLVARAMVEPGDVVAVEEPGYFPVRRLLEVTGAKVVPVRVDAEGLVVDELPPKARLVYVTPSHQSPLGVTMSLPRRQALLAHAERHDVAIVEDDYDSEFRHVDRPLEPLFRLDRSGRVIYVGSFSKTLTPTLRLAFAVLPESIVEPVVQLRRVVDRYLPTIMEDSLQRFIASGALDRHLRRARRIYGERHAIVTAFVEELERAGLAVGLPSRAGLHVAILVDPAADDEAIAAALQQRGMAINPLSQAFASLPPMPGLLIGYGAVPTADLPDALALITEVLTAVHPGSR